MSNQTPDDELRRAIAEAEVAEATLRRMKESLIPRDRVLAIEKLMDAELRAMIARETARFSPAIIAAKTEEEAQQVLESMSQAMLAANERIRVEMLAQVKAWTLAGLEDRTEEQDNI